MKDAVRALLIFNLAVIAPGSHHLGATKACSLTDFTSRGHCTESQQHLVCRGGVSGHWTKGIRREIQHLQLIEWPGECFNVARLQHHFPELRILEFLNSSYLSYFTGRFDSLSRIEKITMHGMTELWEVPPSIVCEMRLLVELDLRRNSLRHMREGLFTAPLLERVYLSDNLWDCSDGGLDWLAMESDNGTIKSRMVDYLELMCHQRLYRGKPLHSIMDIIRTTRETCPEPCVCTLTYVGMDASGAMRPMITVDCANKGLDSPPESIPPDTATLRLEGNKISSIKSIVNNPVYRKIADLYLDNNTLTAVKELESSEWFASFRVLSLQGNQLKQIPLYAFDKALQTNNNIGQVYLGENPWRCDCHFIPRFQGFLRKYKRVFADLTRIQCAKSNDKQTSLIQISTIQLGIVCTSGQEMPISVVNIVNIVLFALLLIVVGRFLYDWHTFKTTGKLPWLSSILP